jgi:hypothetical protein
MSLFVQAVGFALVVAGGVCGVRAHFLDRSLQRFRLPGETSLATMFVPLRWQRRFYAPDGHALVARAWRLTGAMYGLALIGMFLVGLAI